ncbi:MAG TPA: tetratricopeptide repeat protein [Myxococcales bacterium]|jgi:tetratricopeptide (TPR) repeat protein/predicted Ser/Thr protein kinase
MACPAEETLLAFASGSLAPDALETTVEHLDGCPQCRQLAAMLSRAESPAPPPAPPGEGAPQRLGRHLLLDVLGSGAMGVVYRAYDPQLDRKVALKLLRQDRQPDGAERRAHLLREAQAMARVAHPNVIAVHDVGEHGGDIFLAMELVEGPTLRKWLAAQPRSREEIVATFLQAGHGLAAAHAAGLVHRDFKPENVIVGPGGRPRVTDFGLALAGAVFAGTPAYMSPEQLTGRATDARSDQFGFCVALWEALEGSRPFVGASLPELKDSVERALPDSPQTPAWLRRVLEKGLSKDPAQRFASMDELLDELSHDPAVSRRNVVLAAAGLGVAALSIAGLLALSAWQTRECEGAPERGQAVWSAERRGAVEQAFKRSGRPYAADTFRRISKSIDGWLGSWSRMRVDACLATRQRGEQSEELLDLRMACLDRRLVEVDVLVTVLSTADATAVEHASEAVAALGDLQECADLSRLSAAVRAPSPKIRPAVEAVRAKLAESKANRDAGRYLKAVEVAKAALGEAKPLAYPPVDAEVQLALGDAQAKIGDYSSGEQSLRASFMASEAARWDELAARAALRLVQVVGGNQQRFGEAGIWADLAASKIDRLGARADLSGSLAYSRAVMLQRQGRWTEALARCREALPLLESGFGAASARLAEAERLMGSLLLEDGELAQARAHHERALAIFSAASGPEHPDVAMTLSSLGHAREAAGEVAAAEELHRRGLAIAKAALGEDHPYVANALHNLAATAFLRGDLQAANELAAKAFDIRKRVYGATHPLVALSLAQTSEIALARGDLQTAGDTAMRSYRILERAFPADHPGLALPLTAAGLVALETGDLTYARTVLERSLELRREHPGDPARLAQMRFGLARALGKDDPARAEALATEARDGLAKLGTGFEGRRQRIERWLAESASPK